MPETKPRATLASLVLSKLLKCVNNSTFAQLEACTNSFITERTKFVHEKRVLIQLSQINPKTVNKREGKLTKKYFETKALLKEILTFLLRGENRTNFLHMRDLRSTLMKFTERKLATVALCWKFWKFYDWTSLLASILGNFFEDQNVTYSFNISFLASYSEY